MAKFQQMRAKLLKGEIKPDDLFEDQADFISFADRVCDGKPYEEKELEAFLILCLDVYAFSESGRVLIPDRVYDMCMEEWKIHRDVIVYPDAILESSRTWNLVEHQHPGLVGTLPKVYEYRDVKAYLSMMRELYHTRDYILAPKYDGISIALHIKDGMVKQALTRYDGARGQDITRTIQRASIFDCKWKKSNQLIDGWYKCEVCVSTEHFDQLITEKKYANRRSATSGIINTPTNMELGKYLTVIPLMRWDPEVNVREYNPPYAVKYQLSSHRDMMDYMEKMLEKLRSSDFPFRVDGVVMWPMFDHDDPNSIPNVGNLMELAMAFKVNTAEGKTTIEFCYFSIGKLGNAKPMARVKPVEVNETIVTDVALGSYERFKSLNLYEGEEVIIYSAGDVIPQLKKTDYANNLYDRPFLKIPKYCPYCGERLTRTNTEYSCTNPHCLRIVSGRIANFAAKMGIEGFADKTFEDLCQVKLLKEIPDLFKVTADQIAKLPGYDVASANNFVDEVMKLRQRDTQVSQMFGALGIRGISIKKCQKIFEITSLNWVLNHKRGPVFMQISNAPGIGPTTANTFCDFLDENRDMIYEVCKYLRVIPDIRARGSFVFTGFRSPSWEKKFIELGYNSSNSVTGATTFVVAANRTQETSNVKKAIQRGVPLYYYEDIEKVYEEMRSGRLYPDESLESALFD